MQYEAVDISGFGDTTCNGRYLFKGITNGQPHYEKDINHFLKYELSWMPYTDNAGYFIVRVYRYSDAVPLVQPQYKKSTTDLSDNTPWLSFMPQGSGEETTGTVVGDLNLSSSSSSGDINEILIWEDFPSYPFASIWEEREVNSGDVSWSSGMIGDVANVTDGSYAGLSTASTYDLTPTASLPYVWVLATGTLALPTSLETDDVYTGLHTSPTKDYSPAGDLYFWEINNHYRAEIFNFAGDIFKNVNYKTGSLSNVNTMIAASTNISFGMLFEYNGNPLSPDIYSYVNGSPVAGPFTYSSILGGDLSSLYLNLLCYNTHGNQWGAINRIEKFRLIKSDSGVAPL